MKYQNPILPGFHPDPSVCRVGEDYYLVNSSFEYFPGVPIFHSRDMVNWRQIGHCLTRASQLPLEGLQASDGVYAPTIRHHNGRFYMVTTNVSGGGNFYVSTDDPCGEWSEPIWVKQSGIDPSLHFDEDGKVYFTSNGTFWAPIRGIYQCEIDIETGAQLTESKLLWEGTGGAYIEAPHLFKRGEFYYLMVAEGGTEWCHMVTIARSKNPYGPFESCPHNPILTHRSLMNEIQGTGHADLVEDHQGNWWAVFLGIRDAERGFHNLGRETFLAPVEWTEDGWPVVNEGKRVLEKMEVNRPMDPWSAPSARDDFESERLSPNWNFLRNPNPGDYSLTDRPSWLRLRCAAATLDDLASPAFIGTRQQHFDCKTSTLVDFNPLSENEEAGLTVLIDNKHHCELAVSLRNGKRVVLLRRRIGSMISVVSTEPIPEGPIEISITADRKFYHFAAGNQSLGSHEVRYISTEVAGGYTGVYIGLYATAQGKESANAAYFDRFDYAEVSQGTGQ